MHWDSVSRCMRLGRRERFADLKRLPLRLAERNVDPRGRRGGGHLMIGQRVHSRRRRRSTLAVRCAVRCCARAYKGALFALLRRVRARVVQERTLIGRPAQSAQPVVQQVLHRALGTGRGGGITATERKRGLRGASPGAVFTRFVRGGVWRKVGQRRVGVLAFFRHELKTRTEERVRAEGQGGRREGGRERVRCRDGGSTSTWG